MPNPATDNISTRDHLDRSSRTQAGHAQADQTARQGGETARTAALTAENAAHSAVTQAAEGSRRTVEAGAESAANVAQVFERSISRAANMFGMSGDGAERAAQHSFQNMEAVLGCSAVLADGWRDSCREWVEMLQSISERNINGFGAVLRARTPQDLMAAQSDLLRQNVETLLDSGQRLSQLSVRIINEALQRCRAETAARK